MPAPTRTAPAPLAPAQAAPAPAAKPPAKAKDLRPALTRLGRRLAVTLGALAAILSLLAGTAVHVASLRGLAAWFLTLALARLVRASAGSSARAARAERTSRPRPARTP